MDTLSAVRPTSGSTTKSSTTAGIASLPPRRSYGKFARTDIGRLKRMLVDQICQASGGPGSYQGRDMRETHDGMAVTAGEFDALVEDLVATLNQFSVPKPAQDELLGLLGPMRVDIVEDESSETGTPLPDAYRNAPPMAVA
jgi:hemoglobin